jgi:hypothetical protein
MQLFYIDGACRFNGRYLTKTAASVAVVSGLIEREALVPVILKRQGNAEVIDYDWASESFVNIRSGAVFYAMERQSWTEEAI